jgi:hypothetical protein
MAAPSSILVRFSPPPLFDVLVRSKSNAFQRIRPIQLWTRICCFSDLAGRTRKDDDSLNRYRDLEIPAPFGIVDALEILRDAIDRSR